MTETDFPPIEYLQRRIIYYKKRLPVIRKMDQHKTLIARHGKRMLKSLQNAAIARIKTRILEYQKAIDRLQTS